MLKINLEEELKILYENIYLELTPPESELFNGVEDKVRIQQVKEDKIRLEHLLHLNAKYKE
jgi:hypothetical protein